MYGTPWPPAAGPAWQGPAVVADPAKPGKIFAWKLARTQDTFGNRIDYAYERDSGDVGPHHWDQVYPKHIRYAGYSDRGQTEFLTSVTLQYEDRPDAGGRPVAIRDLATGASGFRRGAENVRQ